MMRALLGAVTACAIALAVAAASIRAGDRDLLVSPPESVAENFVRAVVGGRYAPARRHLTSATSANTGRADLVALEHQLHAAVGRAGQVDAETDSSSSSDAATTAHVQGRATQAAIAIQLRFEDAEWKIERWTAPTVLPR